MTLLEWTKDLLKNGVELWSDEALITAKNGSVVKRDVKVLRAVCLGIISSNNAEEWYRLCRLNCPAGTVIEPYYESTWKELFEDTTALVRNELTKCLLKERAAKSAQTLLNILSRRDKEHWAEDKGKVTATVSDKEGKTIEGSKRKKVVSAILKLNIPIGQKLFLIVAKGYSLKDGDIPGMSAERAKKALLSYLLSLKLPKEERAELAKLCGFDVKNGKIVLKSA